jgi:hypothetical protein
LVLVLGVGTTADACIPPQGAHGGDPVTDGSCSGIFDGSPTGSVVKTTSAGPNESLVTPGQKITVTLTWNKRDFGWTGPAATEDCVTIGSHVVKLSQEHKPAPFGGTDTFSYTVPLNIGGQEICDRGVVWGYGGSGSGWSDDRGRPGRDTRWYRHGGKGAGDDGPEESAVLCYSTAPDPAAPEAPNVLLFPVAALVVGAGAVVVTRRRRSRRGLHRAGGLSLSLRSGRHAATRASSGR